MYRYHQLLPGYSKLSRSVCLLVTLNKLVHILYLIIFFKCSTVLYRDFAVKLELTKQQSVIYETDSSVSPKEIFGYPFLFASF